MARRSPSQRRGEQIRGPFRPDLGPYMNHQHVPILPHARTGTQPRAGRKYHGSFGK
jgi:hypothetical protein